MNAEDFSLIVKLMVNDDTLKTIMNIPTADKTNYTTLLDKYFLQTFISDKFTNDGVCRLLIRSGMQKETENDFVKVNSVIIEVYVPKHLDLMSGFQTRINQITDRLIKLFNRVYINDNRLYFCNSYEMLSGSNNFKRYNCKFEYKKVYH